MKKFDLKFITAALTLTAIICTAFSSFAEFGPGMPESELAAYTSSANASDGAAINETTGSSTAGTIINSEIPAEDTSALYEKLKSSQTAQITDQIILVVDHNLTLWNKQSDGSWIKDMDVYCGYGRKGLKLFSERHEGDETTPIGSFPILHAFGFGSNPGTAMTWREITENSYWSGEKDTYNTWVESATPVGGEHLIKYEICYKYAMAIGFNINPTVYKRGSAIFLHCKNPAEWGSAGCVSVLEEDMLTLLQKCHDGCYIMIVPDTDYISYF
ncbi:L,D-peptidoglycan transpeptidase YkuD, ErfK/YbiS/YcfS/YnhG family [Oribacterium sp. KHPX15]|uniref:L,D-transpeptidase family protein n=1 Tax=Oribacterium sp. KHPX15 TaxID=1855342 RepID=UPI00089620C2|nr:L,D-transpeptidase family protein [Oribacterium sp. KHPX15]SDZ89078.1 L,D-peptidoglycan transpeptidase YkuD, ErfK/YbiS/YcfS/YnhG family [Oribacterium sp. KHPX15]